MKLYKTRGIERIDTFMHTVTSPTLMTPARI